MSSRTVREVGDRHVQGPEVRLEQPLSSNEAVQAPARTRPARPEKANWPLTKNVQLCFPLGPLRGQVDQILERLPLAHRVASRPSGQLELCDPEVRLQGHDPKYRLRSGKIVDTDTTAHDGLFNEAFGHARCKRGERLISGGLRLRSGSGGVLPGQNVSMVESGPVPKLREWKVTMNSDLGGLARKDFVVFAYCRG
jgi:hypothetical protein